MKYGKLIQDNNAHWYLIPEDMREHFLELQDMIYKTTNEELWDELIDSFCLRFDQYMLNSNIEDIRIPMEEN